MMKRQDFNYNLDEKFISQEPYKNRDEAKLMLVDRKKDSLDHKLFKDIKDYLRPGDVLVLNESKVIPARIFGHRPDRDETIESLLLKEEDGLWEAMVKPGKKMKVGSQIIYSDKLRGQVVEITPVGTRLLKLNFQGDLKDILAEIGYMPTPPYIKETLKDPGAYQTIYAKDPGSVAAPTAGLHFSQDLLKDLEARGIVIARLTLHVGVGTFKPVQVEKIEDHHMHSEYYVLDEENAKLIQDAKARSSRIIAVGTTSVRTLESIYKKHSQLVADSGWTDIFIYPGFDFKVVDGLITNFHLPESTLLMLVSAFYDREKILQAYDKAKDMDYKFFSFGDAMFIY